MASCNVIWQFAGRPCFTAGLLAYELSAANSRRRVRRPSQWLTSGISS